MAELKDIVSISGQPGLHLIIGKRANGLIVETLDASKRRFPTSLTQKVSILEDISIYTYEGDIKLIEVFRNLHQLVNNGFDLVSKNNSNEEVKTFFRKVVPEYDEEKVYVSDMLKVSLWYQILKDSISFDAAPTEENQAAAEETTAPEVTEA
jgi:hypothetical protein